MWQHLSTNERVRDDVFRAKQLCKKGKKFSLWLNLMQWCEVNKIYDEGAYNVLLLSWEGVGIASQLELMIEKGEILIHGLIHHRTLRRWGGTIAYGRNNLFHHWCQAASLREARQGGTRGGGIDSRSKIGWS
jgi:hypothetical protein